MPRTTRSCRLTHYGAKPIHARALIINNRKFTNLKKRHGTDKDAAKLNDMLLFLGVTDIKTKKDCTAEKMRRLMKEYAQQYYHDEGFFFCAILSHGGVNKIYGLVYEQLPLERSLVGYTKIRSFSAGPTGLVRSTNCYSHSRASTTASEESQRFLSSKPAVERDSTKECLWQLSTLQFVNQT